MKVRHATMGFGPVRPALAALGLVCALGLAAPAAQAAPSAAPVDPYARLGKATIAARFAGTKPLTVDGRILDRVTLHAAYARQGYRLLWLPPQGEAATPLRAVQVLGWLESLVEDGLTPSVYGLDAIRARLVPGGPRDRLDLDLLLSDAVATALTDLSQGRMRPGMLDERGSQAADGSDPLLLLEQALASSSLPALADGLRPTLSLYQALRAQLAALRAQAGDGAKMPVVRTVEKLRPGERQPAVPTLRAHMAQAYPARAAQLMAGGKADSTHYDPALVAAVRHYQTEHGLDADGVVGPDTRDLMNVAATDRMAQIRANLERARWPGLRNPPATRIEVDIVRFRMSAYRDHQLAFETAVIVGKPARQTPLFFSRMNQVVINPTWTIPPTIAVQDKLPRLQRDPEYFDKRGVAIYDAQGNRVSGANISWDGLGRRVLRYRFVQPAGAGNPLGQYKFMMPNRHAVYLHDTNEKHRFKSRVRALSSGCVRVENADQFAMHILSTVPGWNEERVRKAIGSGKTVPVTLPAPIPVFLLYRTAWLDDAGQVVLGADPYNRDDRLVRFIDRDRQNPKRSGPQLPTTEASVAVVAAP